MTVRSRLTLATGMLAGMLPALAMAQDDKTITVVTWNIPFYEEGFQLWVDEFKTLHPDFEVERIDMKGTDLPTFYQTQVVAGTPPDIVDIQGGLWLEYASQGGLVDLTPYLERDADYAERLIPEVLDNWSYEGGTYGVPLYISKTLLFLNMPMLEEAGITEPPTSFDEMMSAAEAMAGGEKTGLMTLNFDWLYWPLFAMNGIEFVNEDMTEAAFNTPEAVALVERLAAATESGAIDKISWTGRWVEPNSAFAAGTVGMLHAHRARLPLVQGQVGLGRREYGPGHQPAGRLLHPELAFPRPVGRLEASRRGVGLHEDRHQRAGRLCDGIGHQ